MDSGDPADAADTWLRCVTNSKHVRKGRVHHAEFRKWLSPPDDAKANWKLELSGQLLSLVQSISGEANARVQAQRNKLEAAGSSVPSCLMFSGVLYNKVDIIRKISVLACNVLYDRQPDDAAHANIVVLDKGPDEILTVTDTLLENLVWVTPDQVSSDHVLAPKQ